MDNKDDIAIADPSAVAQARVIADPLAVAQARVDSDTLTALLERLMDDDDATVATMQLIRERLTAAIMLLEALLKSKARANPSVSPSITQQVEFRDKRPPEKTPRMVVSSSGEPFDLPDFLSQVERHWTANMFSKALCMGDSLFAVHR